MSDRPPKKRSLAFPVITLVCTLTGASMLVGRFYFFIPFSAAGASMAPAVKPSDTLLVTRSEPAVELGRVIVFPAAELQGRAHVARVVGVPGDVVEMKAGRLSVGGAPAGRCEIGRATTDDDGTPRPTDAHVETLGKYTYVVYTDPSHPAPDGRWEVKPGEVFVMGDNRDKSFDSRRWDGGKGRGTPIATIVGVVRGSDAPPAAESVPAPLREKLASCLAKPAKPP